MINTGAGRLDVSVAAGNEKRTALSFAVHAGAGTTVSLEVSATEHITLRRGAVSKTYSTEAACRGREVEGGEAVVLLPVGEACTFGSVRGR